MQTITTSFTNVINTEFYFWYYFSYGQARGSVGAA